MGEAYAAIQEKADEAIKKLEDGGYISRESFENDNRFNQITLTQKGKTIVEKSQDFFAKADYAMFKDFSEKKKSFQKSIRRPEKAQEHPRFVLSAEWQSLDPDNR